MAKATKKKTAVDTVAYDRSPNRLAETIEDSLSATIETFLKEKHRHTNLVVCKCLDEAIEKIKAKYPVKDREALIEQMADEIEDMISTYASQARDEAELEGEVDDDMYEEALNEALNRARSHC